ncbi:MAG: c-type cytochrome biogenesis protein CcmI [Alphaproteobacteria bacterium]
MILFVVLGLMTVIALALLVAPLLRRHGAQAPRADYDIEIYRDQLSELERDVERGLIGPEEKATARTEIERRMLNAVPVDGSPDHAKPMGQGPIMAAFALTVLVPLAAGSIYLGLGTPELEDQPFAERPPETLATIEGDVDAMDIEAMVAGLAERLQSEPDDLDGWVMLGRSYGALARYDQAVAALEQAAWLSDGDADITAMLAEHRVFAADGLVTPAAKRDFEAAQAKDPAQVAARFYLAMARAQAGDFQTALDGWLALAQVTPADAPWLPALREQMDLAAQNLGIPTPDLGLAEATAAPGPTAADMAAAQDMTSDEQAAMIGSMVARLASRLEDEPDDLEGWRRLGQAYGVLGDNDQARDAFEHAAALAPGDPDVLGQYAEAIAQAAPPGAPVPVDAVAVFRRLLVLDGDSPVALWHLGLAAAQTGYDAEARELWGRLLAVIPPGSADFDAVQSAIDGLED